MSTYLNNSARHKFATKQIDWPNEDVRLCLTGSGYSGTAADNFLSDIPSGARVLSDYSLTDLGETNGTCFGTIPQLLAYAAAQTIVGMALYIKGMTDADSQLIYFSDEGIGFPFNAQGINYLISIDQSSGGFFQV